VGSGKTTVSALLAEHGAVVIDADAIAREVVEPGTSGLREVVERFGPGVLGADGRLDRAALARLVFADSQALSDLNTIVHPRVGRRSAELMAAAPAGSVVVYDVPLLAEGARASEFDVVVVVESELDVRLARLARRGMTAADAEARMAAQSTDAQRRAIADEVVRNDGSRADLADAVDALWQRLQARVGAEGATG
jgi:dephospho-CoA kinase